MCSGTVYVGFIKFITINKMIIKHLRSWTEAEHKTQPQPQIEIGETVYINFSPMQINYLSYLGSLDR